MIFISLLTCAIYPKFILYQAGTPLSYYKTETAVDENVSVTFDDIQFAIVDASNASKLPLLDITEFNQIYGTMVYETTDAEGVKTYAKVPVCSQKYFCLEDGFDWTKEDG